MWAALFYTTQWFSYGLEKAQQMKVNRSSQFRRPHNSRPSLPNIKTPSSNERVD